MNHIEITLNKIYATKKYMRVSVRSETVLELTYTISSW